MRCESSIVGADRESVVLLETSSGWESSTSRIRGVQIWGGIELAKKKNPYKSEEAMGCEIET